MSSQFDTAHALVDGANAQALEGVACLVFQEHYFSAFTMKHDAEKLVRIVRKTWGKMPEPGRAAALKLPVKEDDRRLVREALAG